MHKYRMEISKTTVIHPSLLSQTNPIVVYDASQFLLFFSMGNICAKFYFLQIEFVITFVAIVVSSNINLGGVRWVQGYKEYKDTVTSQRGKVVLVVI